MSRKAPIQQLSTQLDADIVQLFCVGGLPPSKVDLPEWKTMWKHAVPDYVPASASTLKEYHIASEASFICTKQLEHLRICNNLSITFDGQTIRLPQSVYTIHIITPDRRIYFFEGNEASEESHTAEHLFKILDGVIIQVGPKCFSGICSDDTGNTRLAWKKVQKKYPWILNLPDPCHRMNLLVKDICTIVFFQPAIKTTRRVIKIFKKSTYASSHLKVACKHHKVSHGLVSIGKTHFGTIYFAGALVQRCLPPIRELCASGKVKIPDVNDAFIPETAETLSFQLLLSQLLAVIGPPAKATKCLESSFATATDVYQLWLAVQAAFYDVSQKNSVKLPVPVLENIRCLCNYRFNQMINEGLSDIFITAYFLVPSVSIGNTNTVFG